MTDDKPMKWDDIEKTAVYEIEDAVRYIADNKSADRREKWDRYYGRNLGNEKKGRSKYMSRDVLEAIEWILPSLIRTFASGDPKIEINIEGQPPIVGKGLMRKIQDDLGDDDDNSIFIAFYQWFKDSLVSDTAYTKLDWVREYAYRKVELGNLALEDMAEVDADENVEITGADEVQEGEFQVFYTNVKAKVKYRKKDRLEINNTPHWEFIVSRHARHMNDEHGKGQKTKVSLDYLKRINRAYTEDEGKPFFKKLDEIENTLLGADSGMADHDAEEESYREQTEHYDSGGFPGQKPKELVDLVEWYTRLDVNGDGYLEDCVVWVANDRLIRWEKNEEEFIPYCALSPILDCYKFHGISYADLLIDIQNLKTMIIRRILDNFAYTNLGRWFAKDDKAVDIRQLLKNVPGDVIRGDADKVQNMAPDPFDASALTLVEWVESSKEQRVGTSRYNQGTDADSLNKTASGIAMIQSAAQQRVELVARIFAETGLKDFYRKAARFYQKYLEQPFMVKIAGKEQQVHPQQIQGKITCRVNMGVEAQVGMVESQKIERMFAFLGQLNQMFPGIIGPEQVHNLATRYITSIGFKQSEDFVQELEKFVQEIAQRMQMQQQMMQQQQQVAAQIEQGKQQVEQAKLQIDMEKVKIDADKLGIDLQLEQMGNATDMAMKKLDVGQRERDSIRDYQADMAKVFQSVQAAKRERAIP